MKNVAIINSCDWGSTGKIGFGLLNNFLAKGYNAHFYYGRGADSDDNNLHKIDKTVEVYVHGAMAKLTGLQGGYSYFATKRLIKSLQDKQIDTIFIISGHGFYLNETLFFDFVGKSNIRLVYTMIDEYAYLGACCNEMNCEKILTGNGRCPNIKKYPDSLFFDNCSKVIKRKMDSYKKLKNAVFVGPEFLVNNSKLLVL